MGYGHGWAVGAIATLVFSTAFLVWLGGKEDSPHQKFAKIIAWIAIVLSSLMVLGSVVMCLAMVTKGWSPPCMREQGAMHQMMGPGMMPPSSGMRGPGMGPGMGVGPGMGRGPGMGMGPMQGMGPNMQQGPMTAPEAPEKK